MDASGHRGTLRVARLGLIPYDEACELQRRIRDERLRGEAPDTLLVLEHPPVLTKGRRTEPSELGMGEDWYRMQGIAVCDSDRGGRVTYHGPGQLVAYPIVDLARWGDDVTAYVRRLERVMIEALAAHGVPAQVFAGLTGVWTAGEPPLAAGTPGPQGTAVGESAVPAPDGTTARKIGSIGIHVSRGVTTHGLAVNVNNDLQPFEWVVPCGIEYARMTSLAAEHGAEQDIGAFADTVCARFGEIFGLRLGEVPADALAPAGG